MSNNIKNVRFCGISTLDILGLILITLKLTGHISVSWWIVCLPFIVEGAIIIGIILFMLICAIIEEMNR
jgi:hypothetical protein